MTVRVYKSTDVGAPSLVNNNSSLINVLKACLVDGYGPKSGAGWTNPFNGVNLAVFRSAATSNQRYLQVKDDENFSNYGYRIARLRGFEDMSDVTTGLGPFPTVAQQTFGLGCSYGSAAPVNDWVLLASDKIFHLLVNRGTTATPNNYAGIISFGDFSSYKYADAYGTILRADSDSGGVPYGGYGVLTSYSGAANDNAYIPRKFDGTGESLRVSLINLSGLNQSGYFGYGSMTFPNGPDNGMLMSELGIVVTGATPRYIAGLLPGMLDINHNMCAGHKDTWDGLIGSPLSGKSFLAFSSTTGQVALEVSDTW